MRNAGARGLLAALLLLALAVRTAIPAGWMPSFGEQGVTLVPCSTWAAMPERSQPAATLHASHGTAEEEPDQSKHDVSSQPCAFAATALDLPRADSAVLLPITRQTGGAHADQQSVAIGRGLAAPPPPSTGPPQLA